MADIFTVKDLSGNIPSQRKDDPEKPKKEENNGEAE